MGNLEEERTQDVCIRRRVIEEGVKDKLTRGATMCTDRQALSIW